MNRKNQDDLRLLKKAKHRIHAMLIVSYLILCLWPAGVYVLLSQPIFSRPDSFTLVYLISMLVQMIVWMAIFFVVSDGKPAARYLLIFGIVLEFGFVGWLLYDMIQNPSFLPVYLIWAALELVKDIYLCWMSGWMNNSWWARIYFDHTIELSESEKIEEARRREKIAQARAAARAKAEREAQAQREMEERRQKTSAATQAYRQSHPLSSSYMSPDIQQSSSQDPAVPSFVQPDDPSQEEIQLTFGAAYEGLSDFQTDVELAAQTKKEAERANRRRLSSAYPRTAIRLALCVYGELILFPVLVHIFQNNFASIDNSSVFAVNLMFTLCILTAVVWTLPIFFLYLKQPGVRKCLIGCIAAQLAVIGFGAWMLYGYAHADPEKVVYAPRVFTLFILLDVVRYALLAAALVPALRLPEIRDRHTSRILSTPQDEEELYEFELIDEEEPEDHEVNLDDLLDRDPGTVCEEQESSDDPDGEFIDEDGEFYEDEDGGEEADDDSVFSSFRQFFQKHR